MGLNAKQLRELVVRPALKEINLWSQAAENLVMGTAAQESRLEYLKQLGGGPALGLFQVEPVTYNDYWDNFITYRNGLHASILRSVQAAKKPPANRVVWDLKYAAIMCRVHYRRVSAPLPEASDLPGLAAYWKKYYNTPLGKGTETEFKENYHRTQ